MNSQIKEVPQGGETAVPEDANDGCVGPTSETAGAASACDGCPNQTACASGAFSSPEAKEKKQAEEAAISSALENVAHIVLVLSGKGGVGKSTVAAQLAHTLSHRGYSVGLLDVDICGPSAPRMCGVSGQTVHKSASGWTPVYANPNLSVMSISFLLQDENAAVVWRGPRKNGLIKQFLTETDWDADGDAGGIDYLLIDTPPGTSDEHISTVQFIQQLGDDRMGGAVVVTTPEEVSMADVRKELNFCAKTKVKVLGIVENMSGLQMPVSQLQFRDPHTQEERTQQVLQTLKEKCPEVLDMVAMADVFPSFGSGPKGMADSFSVPYWGALPLDPNLLKSCEQGVCFVETHPTSPATSHFNAIVDKLVQALPVEEDDVNMTG